LVKSSNLSETKDSSILIGNSIFSVQLASTSESSISDMNDQALKERLAQVDLKNCELKIREKFNLPESRKLIIRKTDYDTNINLDLIQNNFTSNYLSFSFFDSETNQKFSTKVCNDTEVIIKFPLKRETSEKLNLNKYF
jgi:hypothetical protein